MLLSSKVAYFNKMVTESPVSSFRKPLKKRLVSPSAGFRSEFLRLENVNGSEGYFPLRSLPTVWNLCLQINPGAAKPHPTAAKLKEHPLSLRGTHEPLNLSLSLQRLRRYRGFMNLPLAASLSHRHVTQADRWAAWDQSSVQSHRCSKNIASYDGNQTGTIPSYFPGQKSGNRLFNCRLCYKSYLSMCSLKIHIQTHTLPFKCHLCEKSFSRPWLLQGHIRTHTGEKPFSCHLCQRPFADRSNLRAHLQTHAKVKKYLCEKCSKSFSRMSLLRKHKANCYSLQEHP